jgi:hypothetical protein
MWLSTNWPSEAGSRGKGSNLRRRLRSHAHLLHEPVEEVFSFRAGNGLEPTLEILETHGEVDRCH